MAARLRRMISVPSTSIRDAFGGIELRILPKQRLNHRLAQLCDAAQQLNKQLESFSDQLNQKKDTVPIDIWNALNVQKADLVSRYRTIKDTIVQIGANKPHQRLVRAWFAPSPKKRCQLLQTEIRDVKHLVTELITRLTILSATENNKHELDRLASKDSAHKPNDHRVPDHSDSPSFCSAKVGRERLRSSLHDIFNYKHQANSDSDENPASSASSQGKSLKPLSSTSPTSSNTSTQFQSASNSASPSSNLSQLKRQLPKRQKKEQCYCSRLVQRITSHAIFGDTKPDSVECHTKSAVLLASQHGGCFLALQGLPGTGKSTLLHALKHDQDVTSNFTEGVHWLPLRSGVADIRDAICRIAQLVSVAGSHEEANDILAMSDIQTAVEHASAHLSSKRMLLLLDKSWTAGDVGSALVFKLKPFVSSRSGTVVAFISEDSEAIWDARRISITPREILGEDTLCIFLNHAGFTKVELIDPETVEILRVLLLLCYGLPLAMAIAGKSIANATKTGMTRTEAMMLYLEHHKGVFDDTQVGVPCVADIIGDHVHAALQILERTCDNILPPDKTFRDLFLAFCIVDKGHSLPLETLRHLWNLSPGMSRIVANAFDATGIATMLKEQQEKVDELQIHDLVHDYICTELTLADFTNYHSKLVNSYYRIALSEQPLASGMDQAPWNRGSGDGGYYNRNLIRHLYHAGHRSEMLRLVVHPEWVLKQLREVGVNQVDNDIGFVTDFLTFNNSSDVQTTEMTVEEYEEIGAAARTAALNAGNNFQEVAFHFYNRILAVNQSQGVLSSYLRVFRSEVMGPWLEPLQPCLDSAKSQLQSTIRILSRPQCMVSLAGDNYIACGCDDGRIVMLDTRRKRIVGQWRGHTDAVVSMCRSLSGKVIVTSSLDRTIKAWDCATSAQIGEILITDHRQVVGVAVTVDERFVIAGFSDGSILVWDLESGDRVAETFNVRSPSAFTKIELLAGGDRMITSSTDGCIRMWILEVTVNANEDLFLYLREDKIWNSEPFSSGVDCLAIHNDSHCFASASNGFIYVSDLRTGKTRSACDTGGSFGRITTMSFSENGKYLVFGSSERIVHVLDIEKNRLIGKPFRGHTQGVCGVTFLRGGAWVISAAGDETVRIWDAESITRTSSPPSNSEAVTALALTENESILVSASVDGSLRLWDVTTASPIGKPLTGHQNKISAVAVSNAGKHVITGAYDGSLRLWNIEQDSYDIINTFQSHSDWITSVDISPSGDTAASASFDGSVRTWDLTKKGSSYNTLRGQMGRIKTVKVSSDGKRVFTISRHEIRVWNLLSGTCNRRFEQDNIGLKPLVSVLKIVEEDSEESDPSLLQVQCKGSQVRYGDEVLAVLPSAVECFKYSKSNRIVCAGLLTGQVVFLKLRL